MANFEGYERRIAQIEPVLEKYGFKSLGSRKGYYQDNNEDALIMWTENIFYDKFKLLYEQNIKSLTEKVEIKCQG